MSIAKWRVPVTIENGASKEIVESPFEAIIHLTDGWPERTSASFIEARNSCRAAVAGRIDGDVARTKFMAAAEAAKLQAQ